MKANRRPRDKHPMFRDDEQGVSEAVGYIITFGISTIVLVTSLQAFLVIQEHTRTVAIDRTVNEVAAQVAFAVDEALRAGATYPDASFSMTVTVPPDVSGEDYRIMLHQGYVWVVATNALQDESAGETRGRAQANFVKRAGVDVHCTNPAVTVQDGVCMVSSRETKVMIVYKDPDGTTGPLNAGVYFERENA